MKTKRLKIYACSVIRILIFLRQEERSLMDDQLKGGPEKGPPSGDQKDILRFFWAMLLLTSLLRHIFFVSRGNG